MSTSLKPSSSLSQPQFSSSGSIGLRFNIGEHRWVRLLLATIGLYLILLPIWWYALDLLAALAAAIAGAVYHFFDPAVSITSASKTITVLVSPPSGSGFQVTSLSLRLDRCTYGLPMLAALILVTRADSWRNKLRAFVLGVGVMTLFTIPAVMFWAKLASLQLEDQLAGAGNRSGFFYYAFHGYAFSQPVLAVLIWFALMMLGFFQTSPEASSDQKPQRTISQNEPCPCGSRRKYKRCCGREKKPA